MAISDLTRPWSSRRGFVINDAVIAAEVDQETVLLNVETGTYFGLNDVGTDIWRLLPRCADDVELVGSLLEIYDAEWSVLARDVAAFLNELAARGLIHRAEA